MKSLIKKITLEDERETKSLIKQAIQSGSLTHAFIDNQKNVDRIYSLDVRPAIVNQDPVLFFELDGTNIGMTCVSTCMSVVFDFEEPTAIGVFTFIQEQFRRQGFAYRLHREAFIMLQKMGYTRVIGEILTSNSNSQDSCNYLSDALGIDYNMYGLRYECKI